MTCKEADEIPCGELYRIFSEISRERKRQDEKWGEQNYPMLGAPFTNAEMVAMRESLQHVNDDTALENCWFNIFMEEVCEAFAETEPEKQRAEMIQVAAVAAQIIERLDRRMGEEADVQVSSGTG
jgi:hypothetical protein